MDKRKEVTPEKEAKPKTYIIKARQHGKSGWQLDEDTRAVEIAAMAKAMGGCERERKCSWCYTESEKIGLVGECDLIAKATALYNAGYRKLEPCNPENCETIANITADINVLDEMNRNCSRNRQRRVTKRTNDTTKGGT